MEEVPKPNRNEVSIRKIREIRCMSASFVGELWGTG
jgi:hypothetical protein